MSGIKRFLEKTPDAVAYGKRILQAINQRKVSLNGKPEDIVKRAYDFERRGWEGSIESFFDEEDQLAAEKFEKERKRNAKKS